jgi:hypothetical protein
MPHSLIVVIDVFQKFAMLVVALKTPEEKAATQPGFLGKTLVQAEAFTAVDTVVRDVNGIFAIRGIPLAFHLTSKNRVSKRITLVLVGTKLVNTKLVSTKLVSTKLVSTKLVS